MMLERWLLKVESCRPCQVKGQLDCQVLVDTATTTQRLVQQVQASPVASTRIPIWAPTVKAREEETLCFLDPVVAFAHPGPECAEPPVRQAFKANGKTLVGPLHQSLGRREIAAGLLRLVSRTKAASDLLVDQCNMSDSTLPAVDLERLT